MPAAGRKGFLASCQFLPAGTPETLANEKMKKDGTRGYIIVPFFLIPLTGAGAVEGAVVAVDMTKKKPNRGMLSLADKSDGIF